MAKHIWFSPATDITGNALAEALHLNGTKTKPRNLTANDIVIGWGTKIKESTNLNGATVLNHPNSIRTNRNKYSSLVKMSENNHLSASIAKFVSADRVMHEIDHNNITLPLVGRTNYHQGGKGFWLCLTKNHVSIAINEGANYFQEFIDIKDEYRLHIAFGNVIHAVRKVENVSEASWTNQRKEKVSDYANKNNVNLDDATLDYALKILFKEAVLPDRIIRSNRKGWKFSSVNLDNVPAALKNAAIKAVEVIGLDFAAVDCCVRVDDNAPFIIEANSGPGLQGTAFQKYVDAFTVKIEQLENPQQNAVKKVAKKVAGAVKKAVGADVAEEEVNGGGLACVMRNVKNDDEAKAVIQALMKEMKKEV